MRTAEDLRERAWKALVKELGLADALRYLILFQPGRGNYVRERKDLLEDKSVDELFESLRSRKN